jgi:putative Mg2+ transporter-C (MgtC) family protein
MDWLRFDWAFLAMTAVKIVVAFLLALPVAWERERATRIMGLRTFPLVAVASCGYVLVAVALVASDSDNAQARIIQGLMGGIGFLGGGAILKEGTNVRGTATASSVWMMGALGAAVGFSRYEVALILSLITYLTLRFLTPLEEEIETRTSSSQSEDAQRNA